MAFVDPYTPSEPFGIQAEVGIPLFVLDPYPGSLISFITTSCSGLN